MLQEAILLTTRNLVFSKIPAILIGYKNYFPEYPVKFLRMDNVLEFRSHAFEDYYTVSCITLTYAVPYEHSQNGLAEVFITKVQLISRPLLIYAKLLDSLWDNAVLHAATLLRLIPTLQNQQIPYELLAGQPSNIIHLHVFGCQVWVHVSESQRKTIGTHRSEAIYLGYDSPSIIRYMDPKTGTILKAWLANCKFIEHMFPTPPVDRTFKPTPLKF